MDAKPELDLSPACSRCRGLPDPVNPLVVKAW